MAVSPDGTRLAYVGLGGSTGGRELYIRDLAESEGWRVRESEGVRAPFFSPDSQWVCFFADGLLKKVSVSGGAPTTICDANNARGGSWSEEDLIVFAPSSRAPLSLVSAAGGTAEPLTVLDNEYGETTHRIPMFLPGGDAFLPWCTTRDLGPQLSFTHGYEVPLEHFQTHSAEVCEEGLSREELA